MSSRSMKEREIRDSRRGSRKSSTDRKRSSSRRPRSSSRGSKCHRSSKSRSHTPNNSSGVKRRCRVPWKSTTEENKQVIKVVKERAKRRQGTLVCLQIMNLVLQLCLSISIFAVVVCLYALENQHSYWFYYLLQSVVLTIVVSIIVCNPNTCFRIILISGHISTVIYSVFIILEQIRRHTFKLDCWDEEDTCFWQWPLKADFEVGYLGLASILLHTLMFILSILMVFYYEGSIDQLKLKDKAHAILESQITNEPSRRKKVKGNKRQMIILEDRSSLRGKVAKRTINAVFVDKEGEPVVYGQTITTSRSIIYDTPKAVQEKGRRQTVLVEANEQRKKVVEMPALESPIAYLTRKRNEANEMKKAPTQSRDLKPRHLFTNVLGGIKLAGNILRSFLTGRTAWKGTDQEIYAMDNVEIVPCPLRTSDITLKSPFSKQVLSMCWDQDAKKWAPVWIKIIKYLLTKPILIGHRLDNMADEKGEKMTFMLPVINENSLSDPNWRNEFVKAVKLFNSACDLMMGPSIESPAGTPSSTRSNGNLWRRSRCDEELMKLVCETIFSPSLSPKNIGEIAYILSVLPEVLYHQDVVSILGAHSDFSALYLAGIVDVKRINGIVVDPIPAVETVAQFEKLMRYFGKTESPFELHGPGYEIYNDDYIKESTVFFVNNTTIDKDTENELADFVATKVKKTSRIICTKAISSFANHGVKMDKKEKRHMNKTVLHIYTFRRASSVPRLTTEAFTPKRSPSDTEFEPRVKLPRIKISNSPAHDQNITTSKAKSEEDICKYLDDSITSLLSAKKTMIEEHESKLRLQDLLTERENTIKNLEEQIQNTGESFEKKKIALESDLVMIKSELKKQEEDLKLVNSLLKEKKKTSDDEKTTIIHKQKEELDKLKLRLEALESTREAKPQISSDTEQLLRNKTNELAIVMLDRDRLEKQLNQITEDYRELMKKVLNSNNSAPLPPNKEPKEEPP